MPEAGPWIDWTDGPIGRGGWDSYSNTLYAYSQAAYGSPLTSSNWHDAIWAVNGAEDYYGGAGAFPTWQWGTQPHDDVFHTGPIALIIQRVWEVSIEGLRSLPSIDESEWPAGAISLQWEADECSLAELLVWGTLVGASTVTTHRLLAAPGLGWIMPDDAAGLPVIAETSDMSGDNDEVLVDAIDLKEHMVGDSLFLTTYPVSTAAESTAIGTSYFQQIPPGGIHSPAWSAQVLPPRHRFIYLSPGAPAGGATSQVRQRQVRR